MRWGIVALAFLVAVVLVLPAADSNLVAYYDFDGDFTGTSGYCQHTVPAGTLSASGSPTAVSSKFGSSFDATGTTYMTVNDLNLFPGESSSEFSISAWIRLTSTGTNYGTRNIARKESFFIFQLNTLGSAGKNYALFCRLYFSSSVFSTVSTSNTLFTQNNGGYWSHVACVYNSTHLCVAYNGTTAACVTAAAQQVSPQSGFLTASSSSNPLRGYLDELKFYDHALTAEQLMLLSGGVDANDMPSATIMINGQSGPASAPALTTLQVLANSVDARAAYSGAAGSQMSYSWSVLSSVCGIAELSNSTSAQPSLVLGSAMGSLVLSVCATDGEESTYVTARVQVGASEPVIQTQTEGPYLDVPLGYVNYPVSVTAGGVPAPTYQWQYLTLENVTLPDTNDTTDNTTTVMVRRNVAHDDDSFESEFVVRWLDNRALTEVWNNIDGAVSYLYRLNGTMENNNQSIRCLVTNTGGLTYSNTFVVRIAAAQSPSAYPSPNSPTSGDSSNVGAIVGGVVGGSAGLFCLLLLLLALLALVLARRRSGRRREMRKLTQPDYAALAYGDVENVALAKRKAEHYEKLEKLLLAENGRLAHALFVRMSSSDADKACKAVMRVFEANHQGYHLLERRITDEVAMADDEGTLFRANSIAARLFGTYVRMTSLPFIWKMLVTSVNALNDNALEAFGSEQEGGGAQASRRMRYQIDDDDKDSGSMSMDVFASSATTMEIDPHKVDEASDRTINSLELWLVAQKLFKCIVDSERIMPTQIKQLMHHIDAEVGGRFSEQAQFRALGGFIFLRMVCPALMAPQVYGLLDAPPHPVAQRQFILVSKVLQNLANDTLPGAKETWMEQLNSFIASNKAGLERFYQKVLNDTDRGKPAESDVPAKAKQASLMHLHKFISGHMQAIEQDLKDDGGEQMVEELKEVLAQLGDDSNV